MTFQKSIKAVYTTVKFRIKNTTNLILPLLIKWPRISKNNKKTILSKKLHIKN